MKVLHLIRTNDDALARRVIEEIDRTDGAEQTLVLIQDGVYMRPEGRHALACGDDVRARGIETDVALIDYDGLVDMIFEHDKVITW